MPSLQMYLDLDLLTFFNTFLGLQYQRKVWNLLLYSRSLYYLLLLSPTIELYQTCQLSRIHETTHAL